MCNLTQLQAEKNKFCSKFILVPQLTSCFLKLYNYMALLLSVYLLANSSHPECTIYCQM